MVSEKMHELGTKKSTLRTIFEYGQKRAAEVGAENVFDFSLGNPSVPTPDFIRDAAVDILTHSDPMGRCTAIQSRPANRRCARSLPPISKNDLAWRSRGKIFFSRRARRHP